MSARLPEHLAKDLDAKCQAVATVLAGVEATEQPGLLAAIIERIVTHSEQIRKQSAPQTSTAPPKPVTPTPEILEWARNLFTEEEALAGLREIRQTGGLKFSEVIQGLEPPASHG